MSRWTIISIIITVVLIGIPTAANFYPPIFAGIADRLPLNLLLTWMGRMGILSLGLLGGWWARDWWIDQGETHKRDEMAVSEIEGCIEIEQSCWRGSADISSDRIVDIRLKNRAYCPNCQTVMYDGESNRSSVSGEIGLYECPNCSHSAFDKGDPYRDAEKLFERHVCRIVESEGEEYSIDNLINEINGDVTPRRIWQQYASISDDSNVSMNCFP
jgi:Zn-finger nucleic acid-binding protein